MNEEFQDRDNGWTAPGNELITRSHHRIVSLMETIRRLDKSLDEIDTNHTPSLLHERYMTDKQLSQWLHIARCTLLEYRNRGILPYYTIGGKIYYKERDIDKLLRDNLSDIIP
jgi:hypothetical protein